MLPANSTKESVTNLLSEDTWKKALIEDLERSASENEADGSCLDLVANDRKLIQEISANTFTVTTELEIDMDAETVEADGPYSTRH